MEMTKEEKVEQFTQIHKVLQDAVNANTISYVGINVVDTVKVLIAQYAEARRELAELHSTDDPRNPHVPIQTKPMNQPDPYSVNAQSLLAALRQTMRDCGDRETRRRVAAELSRLAKEITTQEKGLKKANLVLK